MADGEYKAGHNYVLTRDKSEFARLNVQHVYLTTTVYEGRLIFDESVEIGPDSAVLDSGTGSGSWILDLAGRVLPSVQLHGSDVSANNFPETHPTNLYFHAVSSTDFPKEWSGKFDVVNQRMLMGALLATEWPVVLSEIFRVLKPGGYAQFVDMDLPVYVMAGPCIARFRYLVRQLYKKNGLLFDAAQRLPLMLKDAGFVKIVSEKKFGAVGESWGKIGKMGATSWGGAVKNIGLALIKAELIGKDEFAQLQTGIEEEFEKVEGTQLGYRLVHARKAT